MTTTTQTTPPKQSRAAIARILGYKHANALAIYRAQAALRPGEAVLGWVRGTGRCMGAIKCNRVRKLFPTMTQLEVVAYGRSQGEDKIAVIGVPPAAIQ